MTFAPLHRLCYPHWSAPSCQHRSQPRPVKVQQNRPEPLHTVQIHSLRPGPTEWDIWMCVTLDSKDLVYQVIDHKQWTDEWNNRCVNSSSSLTQFMLLRSLTVLDIDGSGEGSVPCSKALSIMWDVQFAGWQLTSEIQTHDVKLWRIWIRQNKTQPSPVTVEVILQTTASALWWNTCSRWRTTLELASQ